MKKDETMKNVRDRIFGELQADGFHRGEDFGGMEVYVPEYDAPACIGYPLVVFAEKDGSVRLSSPQEAMDYLVATAPPADEEEEDGGTEDNA